MASTSEGDKKAEKTPCTKLGAPQRGKGATYVYVPAGLYHLCPQLETFT